MIYMVAFIENGIGKAEYICANDEWSAKNMVKLLHIGTVCDSDIVRVKKVKANEIPDGITIY